MSRLAHETFAKANGGGAPLCTTSEQAVPLISAVMRVVRGWWPTKTAEHLGAATGACERQARYWLACRRDLSADDLAALLRTDNGIQILEQIIGPNPPAWWRSVKRQYQLAELRRGQEQQKRLLKRLEEAEG